jgi:hypothetical protein
MDLKKKQQPFSYTIFTDWILKARRRVFTARYRLNPCITQIRFIFRRLKTIIYFLQTSILLEFSKLGIYFDTETVVYYKKFTQPYFMFGVRARDRSIRDLIRNLQYTFLNQSTRMYVYLRSCNKHTGNTSQHLLKRRFQICTLHSNGL